MNTQQVADRLVSLCRAGENMKAVEELYADHIVSKEMPSMPNNKTEGKDKVIQKSKDWYANLEEFHGGSVSDPIVADNHFSCSMKMDCTFKDRGRTEIEELCVYQVADGQIVEEQFFYQTP